MRQSTLKIALKDKDKGKSFAALSAWSHSKLRLKNSLKWISDALWEEHVRLHPRPTKAAKAAAPSKASQAKAPKAPSAEELAEAAARDAEIAKRKAETVASACKAIEEYRGRTEKAADKASQLAPSDPDYKGLGPAFIKWMFGGSCKSWTDKADFSAMPSRAAQGAADERLAEIQGYAAKLSKGDKAARPPGFIPDSRLPSVGFQVGDMDLKRRPDEEYPSTEWVEPAMGTRGKKGKAGARVAYKVRLPEEYAFKKLLAVRFKPVGGCVDTGRRTDFGKKIFEGVEWEMHLVFDLDEAFVAPAKKGSKGKAEKGSSSAAPAPSRSEQFSARTQARNARKAAEEAEKAKAEAGLATRIAELAGRVEDWKSAGSQGPFPVKAAGVDPGVSDLLAVVHSWGERSWVLGAGEIRGANSEAELKVAFALGELSEDGDGTASKGKWSKAAAKATVRRNRKIEALCRDAAIFAAKKLIEAGVEAVFVGEAGAGWKDGIARKGRMNREQRRRFQKVPHEGCLGLMSKILENAGILVFRVEEAYTSASSFLDDEVLPELGPSAEELKADGSFGGRRVSRGLFVSRDGTSIQADANGAGNILRRGLLEALGAEFSGKALAESLSPKEKAEWLGPVRHSFRGIRSSGQDEALKAERRAFVQKRRLEREAAKALRNDRVRAGASPPDEPGASKPSAGASAAREKQAPGGSTLARAKAARKLRLAQRKSGRSPDLMGPFSESSGLGPRPMAGQENSVEGGIPSS